MTQKMMKQMQNKGSMKKLMKGIEAKDLKDFKIQFLIFYFIYKAVLHS